MNVLATAQTAAVARPISSPTGPSSAVPSSTSDPGPRCYAAAPLGRDGHHGVGTEDLDPVAVRVLDEGQAFHFT